MSLQNIIDAQKELDARIIKEKKLEDKDLTPNTFLALKVELAEFANEGRWFKHWSKSQEHLSFIFAQRAKVQVMRIMKWSRKMRNQAVNMNS